MNLPQVYMCSPSWTQKLIVALEKILESPLEYKMIKPINPKGNQPWIFIGRTDAEAEAPVLWPLDTKRWLIGKDPNARKDWGKRRRRQQRMRCLDSIIDLMDMNLSKLREIMKDRGAWHAEVHWVAKNQPRLSNWTVIRKQYILIFIKNILVFLIKYVAFLWS